MDQHLTRSSLSIFSSRRGKVKKTVVRITGFLLILLMVLAGINRVFKMKYGDGIYSLTKFYEQKKDSVDVLVLGSSHAFENINTGTLWDEYGMASYVLGGSRQPSWNTYYYLKEALKTQRPELIVLEGYMLLYDADYEESSRIIKNNFGLKWSKDKIESIKVSAPKSQWAEYFLEYTQYHTRYRELSREDFLKNQGYRYYDDWKGFGCNLDTIAEVGTDVKQVDEVSPLYGKTEEYYRKILDLAREENIPVLVTIAPYFLVDEKSERMFNRVGEIAGEYGDLFLDGNKLVDEIGVDYQVDNADDVGHLNYLGNQKYTKYLGTYIKEHYTVSDRRADAAYESWQKNAGYIREMIVNQELKESGDMETISEKLQNPNYWVFISVDDSCNGEDQELQRFLGAASLGDALQNGFSAGVWLTSQGKILNATGAGTAKIYIRKKPKEFCIQRMAGADGQMENQIICDRVSYRKVDSGVNVVVYDLMTEEIEDQFGIDVSDGCRIVR